MAATNRAYEDLVPHCQATPVFVENLVAKARPLALRALGDQAEPDSVKGDLPVATFLVDDLTQSPYGKFMSAWPVRQGNGVIIYYLQDWTPTIFFQREVFLCVLRESPELQWALLDRSRLEVGIMNDVLQCFVKNPPVETYSMIRHHALMLFEATLWLEPVKQQRWLQLYKSIAKNAQRTWPRCNLERHLHNIESRAFEIFKERRDQSLHPQNLWQLLSDRTVFLALQQYFEAAAVAVGVLAWGHGSVPPEEQENWLYGHVANRHSDPAYQLTAMDQFVYWDTLDVKGDW